MKKELKEIIKTLKEVVVEESARKKWKWSESSKRNQSENRKRLIREGKIKMPKNVFSNPEVHKKGVETRINNNSYKSWCKGKSFTNPIIYRGYTPYNKGKSLNELFGKERAKEIRRKISKSFKERVFTEEHKLNMSKSAKIVSKRVFLKKKDTKIEIKIQKLLSLLHLEFVTHKYISEITHSYRCDIFIPEQKGISQKTIIECDGCYWHGCKSCIKNINKFHIKKNDRDRLRTKELTEKGFRVIRLWEHEIKELELDNLREIIYDKRI